MPEKVKLFIPLIIFVMLAAVFLSLQVRRSTGDFDPNALPSARIGQTLPEFELGVLHDDGQLIANQGLPQKPFLLNVWATWCVSCKVEHPYLNELSNSGITIVGLNYKDERIAANKWLDRLGNPYLFNLFDLEGKFGLNLGVYGAPETYVIDENGIVQYRHVGVMNDKVWQRKILPLGIRW